MKRVYTVQEWRYYQENGKWPAEKKKETPKKKKTPKKSKKQKEPRPKETAEQNKIYTVIFRGSFISTNVLKGKHWSTTKKKVDELKEVFRELIEKNSLPFFPKIQVEVIFRSRHDMDGVPATTKFFVDMLVEKGRLIDDNTKYWDYFLLKYDPQLEHNTLIFNLSFVP